MVSCDQNTYMSINQSNQVAYLSCDKPVVDSYISPNAMLAALMQARPKAVVLYSVVGNWCSLEGSNLPYQSIFTMSDGGDAAQALSYLNGTNGIDQVQVSITGNTTAGGADVAATTTNGSNSAVAMSILYSITGLITMLFLVIIATGAIRAHRYPERYGPRSGYGGRPRQSRAKGIARAVLETIPIIKFGSPEPAKPDPAHELEEQMPIEHPTTATQRQVALDPGNRQARGVPKITVTTHAGTDTKDARLAGTESAAVGDENLGCSICTEDFTVGEDVRVLPCSHKFHPPCVDPWLVNVSGTCPLW
jgi:RING-like zinc finger